MDPKPSLYKKIIFFIVSISLFVGYGYFVYAAAPPGGYTPGGTLDPDCAPLDTDCIVALTVDWSLAGNAGTTAGTNFIGTTDAVDFVVKVNGNEMARFYNDTGTSANSVSLGGAIVNATNMFAVGNGAGNSSTALHDTILIGNNAGSGATNIYYTNFLGPDAGNAAVNAYQSNFFGYQAGYGATGANNANFFGASAGSSATGAANANFFGYQAGSGATSAANSNFFGYRAGEGATAANQANFMGLQAGLNASGANNSNFFGFYAGSGATSARVSNFIGYGAGYISTNAIVSNFIGWSAGGEAPSANYSNFMGREAGFSADNASQSNFFGPYAGRFADNANNSNFIGYYAGHGATNANLSSFIGSTAGNGATNAAYSNFIGWSAGQNAANAKNSIFIGQSAGNGDSVNNTVDADDFSILIGKSTSTGGFSNSIAIGGSATNTASNQFMIGSTTRPITSMVLTGDYTGGSCTFAVGGMSCSSDERLKTNIEDLQNTTLDAITNIRTVRYNWSSNPTGTKQVGFIAQNLQQYFPELVSVGQGGYLQVNYAQMTPILVEAIREMNLNVTMLSDVNRPNALRNSLIAWLGNTANGVTDLYAKVFHADRGEFTNEVCLGQQGNQTCVTKDQLDQLLQNSPQVFFAPPTNNPPSNPDVTVTPDDTIVPADQDNTTTQNDSTLPSTDQATGDNPSDVTPEVSSEL